MKYFANGSVLDRHYITLFMKHVLPKFYKPVNPFLELDSKHFSNDRLAKFSSSSSSSFNEFLFFTALVRYFFYLGMNAK